MATTIDALFASFSTFNTDFTAFVASVTSALNNISAGGITPAQQTELDTIATQVATMDAAVKSFVFPAPPATK